MSYEWLFGLFAVLGILFLFIFLIAIALYVLGSLGLYQMAKNRGLENPWLAWIPIGSQYLMCKMVEPFAVGETKVDNFAKVYLIAYAACFVGSMIPIVSIFAGIGLFVLSIVMYIVFYKLYMQYAPQNAVLFLVLSIVLAASPIILFILRNKPAMLPSAYHDPMNRQQ